MNTCSHLKEEWVPYLSGVLDMKKEQQLLAHLNTCLSCRQLFEDLKNVWSGPALSVDTIPPPSIRNAILNAAALTVSRNSSRINGYSTIFALFAGLLATLISAFLFLPETEFQHLPAFQLLVIGAIWSMLYALAFYYVVGGHFTKSNSLKNIVKTSLMALGVFTAFSAALPIVDAVHFCRYASLTHPFFQRLSIGMTFFLMGLTYAFVPMLIAAYISKMPIIHNPLVKGGIAGFLFVVIVLPGIYLQCVPLAMGAVVGWNAGMLLGSVVGGYLGFWLKSLYLSRKSELTS